MAKIVFSLHFILFLVLHATSQNTTMQTDTSKAREMLDRAYQLGKRHLTIDSALVLTHQSISIYKEHLGMQCKEVGEAFHYLAILYAGKGKPQLSIEYDLKSLEITKSTIGYNSAQVSNILLNLGQWYRSSDDETALKYSEECLALRKQLYGEIHPEVAGAYGNIALIYWDRRDYNKAIEYNLKSLSILEQMPEKDSLAISSAYTGLANIYGLLGQYDQVNQLYEKALAIRLKKLGFKNTLVARTYSNLGHFYFEQNRYSDALAYHANALAIRRELMPSDHEDIATSYNNLGLVLDAVGLIDSAVWCFQQAITIREKKLPANHPRIGGAYFNLAESFFHKGDLEQAILFYRKAFDNGILNLNTIGPDFITRLQAFLHALELDNRPEAIKELFTNLEIENSRALQPASLQGRIRLLQIQGKYFASIYGPSGFSAEKTLEPFEEMDRLLSSDQYLSWPPDLREYFLSDLAQGYFTGARACLKVAQNPIDSNYLERAFRYSEKAKSFLLYSKLRDEAAKLTAGIPAYLLARERELYAQIGHFEDKINQEKNKGALDSDSLIVSWSGKLFDLKVALEDFKKDMEGRYPKYYRLKYDLNAVDIPNIQNHLLKPDQALVEYFSGDSLILVFVIRQQSLEVIPIPKDFPLDDWVKQLQNSISEYPSLSVQSDLERKQAITRYIETSFNLYDKLVKPFAGILPSSLIIVPDGILSYLPFEALLVKLPADRYYFQGFDFLGKKHRISYCYSATLLREMRNNPRPNLPAVDFIGFAPYYTGDTSLLANLYGDDHSVRKDLAPLPNSGKELYEIQKIMGGIAYYGKDATELRFLHEADRARIIHLATHARADNRVGDYAWLAFTEIKDSIENELVFVRDLYNLSLNADLVVLSACETGLGEWKQGEGIISLARAFTYAGAKSILTTLWNVNDAQSSQLMILFYSHLKRGLSPENALWKAKMEYLATNDGDKSHPCYWAAFIGIGF